MNRRLPCVKVIFHTSLLQRALDGGRGKYENFANSEDGEILVRASHQDNWRKALKILLEDENTSDNMSDEEITRHELFSLSPSSIAPDFINKANKYGQYPIVEAAHNKDIKLVKALYDAGQLLYVQNDDGKLLIREGSDFFNGVLQELVTEELKQPRTYNSENPGFNAIQLAIAVYKPTKRNLREIVKLFKYEPELVTSKDKVGRTLLMQAALYGHLDLVKLFIKLGFGIDEADQKGITSLFEASTLGYFEIVQYLVGSGADVDKADNVGFTPLYIACQEGHSAIVQYLVGSGADVDKANNEGFTPLHIACQEGHSEVVRVLILHGANVNSTTRNLNTPLIMACLNGKKEVVEMLLQVDRVDTSMKTANGKTAKALAVECGFPEIADLLS